MNDSIVLVSDGIVICLLKSVLRCCSKQISGFFRMCFRWQFVLIRNTFNFNLIAQHLKPGFAFAAGDDYRTAAVAPHIYRRTHHIQNTIHG